MDVASVFPHRITILTGHYGVGKTEVCVNLAMALAREGVSERLALADLDIVNPYFRSRERRDVLEAAGVDVISSSPACSDADIPSLPPQLLSILQDRGIRGLLDIGGDPVGARVLARFAPQIRQEDHALYCVINANRPEVSTKEAAAGYLHAIEEVTGLRCAGLIDNTHLCGETTVGEILKGAQLCAAVSAMTGAPVVCHVAKEELMPALSGLSEPILPMTVYMRKPWERPVAPSIGPLRTRAGR